MNPLKSGVPVQEVDPFSIIVKMKKNWILWFDGDTT